METDSERVPRFKIRFLNRVMMNVTENEIIRTEAVKMNDPKICEIGKSLGLSPEECFECEVAAR